MPTTPPSFSYFSQWQGKGEAFNSYSTGDSYEMVDSQPTRHLAPNWLQLSHVQQARAESLFIKNTQLQYYIPVYHG